MTDHLQELARQVRGHTIALLESTPVEWLLWAPSGTSNHILWHAGHAVWLQDKLGIELITGVSELPDGWAAKFGANSRPSQTTQWPQREELRQLLQAQLDRLNAVITEQQERLADGPLVERLIHGLHDEARHQGEMYLLLKLQKSLDR